MLNFKSRLFRLLILSIFFSVVVFTNVEAKDMVMDFRDLSEKLEDMAHRDVIIWKVSEDLLGDKSREKLVKDLEGKSIAALNQAYPWKVYQTDKNGLLHQDFSKGTYYVRLQPVAGKPSVYPFVFVVENQGKGVIYPKKKENLPPGDLELLKVSTDNLPLEGAVFRLYRLDGSSSLPIKNGASYDFVTNKEGKISLTQLAAGSYVFEEIKAPKGFEIKTAKTYVDVQLGKTSVVKVVNYKKDYGGKRFKKVDFQTKEGLEGASFFVTKKTDKGHVRLKAQGKDLVLQSGKDGYFILDNVAYGDYYLWEAKAPRGYEGLSQALVFKVDQESLKKDMIIENKKGEIKYPKLDKKENPGKAPGKKQVKIPKTGDISLILMTLAGLLSVVCGIKLVKENKL